VTTTRATLIGRLADHRDGAAWSDFFDLYAPFIFRIARGEGLSIADAEDIRDGVLESVVQKIHAFEYRPETGRFRDWLRTIVRGKIIDLRRRQALRKSVAASDLPQPIGDDAWEKKWREETLRFAVDRVRRELPAPDRNLLDDLLSTGFSAGELAKRHGRDVDQVYKLKARALRRMREIVGESE
jgi:RNA polymerase sigma factor (sigma-70 family)